MIFKGKRVAVFALGTFCLSPILALASKGAGSEELNAVANEFVEGVLSTTLKSPPLSGLNTFGGRSEMPDKKQVQEAGLTQGEHFVLFAVVDLCRMFLPDAQNFLPDADGRGWFISSLTVDSISQTLLRAAQKAYGADSKKYEVIKQGLNTVGERFEMPDEKKIHEAGLTQGEHFVFLTAIDLCWSFVPYDIWREPRLSLTGCSMYHTLLWAAKEAYGAGSKKYEVITQGLNAFDGRSEMPDKKKVQEAGLTQGEHFVLLAVINLCRIFLPDANGGGYGLIPSRNAHIMNAHAICMTFLWAARNAYDASSKKYEEIESALRPIILPVAPCGCKRSV